MLGAVHFLIIDFVTKKYPNNKKIASFHQKIDLTTNFQASIIRNYDATGLPQLSVQPSP